MHTEASSAGLNYHEIEPLDRSLEPQFRGRIDGKAKPLGSLGRLEDLAVQLGLIWHPLAPRTGRAVVFVFAADHGLVAEGVSLVSGERHPRDGRDLSRRTSRRQRACKGVGR